MKEKPIYISFATQKGGAGKTGFTILAASILHYTMGYNVAVIDCDYPQNSVLRMRTRDLEHLKNSDFYKNLAHKQFTSIQKKIYSIIQCDAKSGLSKATELCKQEPELDIILFDLPGTVNQEGVLSLLANMDHIFCPIVADRVVMASSVNFALEVKKNIMDTGVGIQNIFMFWNLVDARERTNIYKAYEEFLKQYNLPILNTRIPYLVRFRKEIMDTEDVFRCTIFPASTNLQRDSKIGDLIKEICSKINLGSNG
ncbi:MAG: ParA family protein [Bacteroidales bacterium]